jgi:hypothetical protein
VRGVIYNMTPNNTEEELLSLQHQEVKEVKIFAKQRLNNTTVISTMVTLGCSTQQLFHEKLSSPTKCS